MMIIINGECTTINLLPCPFCGSKAYLYDSYAHIDCMGEDCGIEMEGYDVGYEALIKAWNTRSPLTKSNA